MTGLDPKPWCCMHRLHHLHSDTKDDPHSPLNGGVWNVMLAQKNSFGTATWGLVRKEEKYTSVVKDLDFPVNWLSSHDLWWVPYATQAAIGIAIGIGCGGPENTLQRLEIIDSAPGQSEGLGVMVGILGANLLAVRQGT